MSSQPSAPTRPPFAPSDPLPTREPPSYLKDAASAGDPFDPPESIIDLILTDAANPNFPVHIIADKAGTTVQALQRWLARPDISARLDTVEHSLRRRARLKVLHEIDNVTEVCATVMARYHRSPDRGSTLAKGADRELRSEHIITRNASNALLAARILLYTARYLEGPPRTPRQQATPTPQDAPTLASGPNRNPNPNLNRPHSASTPPFRLLPSLTSFDLHDFREYLTSNHHSNGHTLEELTPSSGHNSLRDPDEDALRIPGLNRLDPEDLLAHTRPPQSEGPPDHSPVHSEVGPRPTSAAQANASPPPRAPAPERSGPAIRSVPTLLTIAGTSTPRSRDPT